MARVPLALKAKRPTEEVASAPCEATLRLRRGAARGPQLRNRAIASRQRRESPAAYDEVVTRRLEVSVFDVFDTSDRTPPGGVAAAFRRTGERTRWRGWASNLSRPATEPVSCERHRVSEGE